MQDKIAKGERMVMYEPKRPDGTERERIAPHLPPYRSGKQGHPYSDHRQALNGILWSVRTGAPWAAMPERYGSYTTCWGRFNRWRESGVWQRILTARQSAAATSATPIGDT